MSRLHKLVALVFLVLWAPITGHCYLEKIPGLEFLHCASDTADNSNCAEDGCQIVESGFYKISDNTAVVPVPVYCLIPFTAPISLVQDSPPESCGVTQFRFPPDLPQSWQFISRTALPIRAPSLVS
jgi:hypothetical protein